MAIQKKTRIFVECTQTFFKGGNSGIQRVVRNLANNGRKISRDDVEVYPLVWMKFGFCRPARMIDEKVHFLVVFKDRTTRYYHAAVRRLSAVYAPRFVKKTFRFLIRKLKLRKRKRSFKELPFWVKGFLLVPLKLLVGSFVTFRSGDIVVLVDSTWKSPLMLEALFNAQREREVVVGAMIHDLFPLLMPENCEEVTVSGFTAWFNRIAPMMDFFVTNSEATKKSLAAYFDLHPELKPDALVCGSFRLGAELDMVAGKVENSEHLQPIWDTPGRAILAVGTIEPRKNYSYLLDAFDILRTRDVDVSLIIVGRPGWKNADVIHRIWSHPDFESRLLHLADASDRDLAEAIERADCLVCPSIAEGFGLPVVEGLMRGLPVFASDIPVFHESGDGYCQFFNLDSPDSLVRLLENWFAEIAIGGPPAKTKLFSWADWKESTEEFLSLVLNLAKSPGKNLDVHHGLLAKRGN